MFIANYSINRRLRTVICILIIVLGLTPLIYQPITTVQGATVLRARLVNVIDTSQWNPPSPDPSGITYWPSHDTLLVVDAEVEEMGIWAGVNMFEATTSGDLVGKYSTMPFTTEPVGVEVAVNPANEHIFISDDSQKLVFEVDLGPDEQLGTGDDTVTSFSTSDFGNNDPEGIAFGNGRLYLTDGLGAEVYIVDPGDNEKFDGVPPGGDDLTSHFDTAVLGQPDPEGLDYDPTTNTVYIISSDGKSGITEATTTGGLIRTIDTSFLDLVFPGDITLAPGSLDPTIRNFYIADRGVDNNKDPNENDGKIYELTLVQATNLLTNPDFELDDDLNAMPDGWSHMPVFTRSSEVIHGGSYAGKHSVICDLNYKITQTVPDLTAGTTYSFAGWVNILPTNTSFVFKLQIRWLAADGTAIQVDTFESFDKATDGWKQVFGSFTAPTGTTSAEIRMSVENTRHKEVIIYVDDFSLTGP